MVYAITLSATELSTIRDKLRADQRMTKAFAAGSVRSHNPRLVLIVRTEPGTELSRTLAWIGVAVHKGKVGPVDDRLTVDHLREITEQIPLDGDDGLLLSLSEGTRQEVDRASHPGIVGAFDQYVWNELRNRIQDQYPQLRQIFDWLGAIAEPAELSSADPADRIWQEERDAVGTIARIFDTPPTTFQAWQRPQSPDAPYLAGLIHEPSENSMIEHDARVFADDRNSLEKWFRRESNRAEIHTYQDSSGRILEIANVNATGVEARLGTDLIYYHHPTSSFVLVQYKRLHPQNKTVSVDDRLRGQLDRLEAVSKKKQEACRTR